MKLSEIKPIMEARHPEVARFSIEPAGGRYGELDVEVEFYYEAEGYTQHEPDNSSFREYHSADIEIVSVKLDGAQDEYDEDGDQVVKKWPDGTDVTTMPGWSESKDIPQIEQILVKHLEDQAKDI